MRVPLTLALLGSTLAALMLAGFFLFKSLRARFLDTSEANLRSHAESIASLMGTHMDEVALTQSERKLIAGEMMRLSQDLGARFCFVNWRGDVLEDSNPDGRKNVRDLPEVYEALNGRYRREVRQGSLFVAVPMRANGKLVGAVYASRPLDWLDELLEDLRYQLVVVGLWAGLLALVVSLGLGAFLTRPLTRLTTGVERVSQGDYGHRLNLRRGDELGRLGRDIDQMAARLEDHRRLLTQFVSDASHELKTPIASLRALSEALADGALEQPELAERFVGLMAGEVARMERLVTDMLTLTRGEGEVALRLEQVRLRPLAEEALASLVERSPGLIVLAMPPELELRADPHRLAQVLINLVDNGLRAVADQPSPRVEVGAERHGGEVVIWVQDNGVGLTPDEQKRVFERFYRVDQDRSRHQGGTGLGLAICLQTVQAHGGRISIESEPQQGARFVVTLPASV
ncbi:MAG: HAMP domain-containing protein [Candidatus Eremiobacteraeota bacterium]|nr:HAMP domain-containing protein [Candidatus Eremiobacteraeota bacterium]